MKTWILAVSMFGVIGWAGCGTRSEGGESLPPARGEGAPSRPDLPVLTTQSMAPGDPRTATAGETTGTTYAIESSQIGPNASGVIARIFVEEGDAVAKNEVLFRLDPRDASLRLQQARAALKTAEVQLASARLEWERAQRLLEKNAINPAQADRIRAQYEGAQAGVEQAKVSVAMAQKMLADATVRAPFAGVVTQVLKSEGEMATMMPPTVVLIIEDHSRLELKLRLPERALRDLEVGDSVTAEFTAIDTERKAEVIRISPQVDPQTRTIELVAMVDNQDRRLKPGMLAKVRLGAKTAAAPGRAGSEDAAAENAAEGSQ